MRRSRLAVHVALLVVCTICFTTIAHAQYRASLRGTVSDPQGAAIPGAKVTLVNTDTNSTLVSTSDGNGIYNFNGLPPAPYRITAEHEGFKKRVLEQVRIIPEQLNALDLQLELGQVDQTVTVSITTQALDTETATVSGHASGISGVFTRASWPPESWLPYWPKVPIMLLLAYTSQPIS